MNLPPISPLLFYRDPKAALDFFERAFGFETRLMVEVEGGGVIHSESAFEGHVVIVVGPPSHRAVSPLDIEGQAAEVVAGHDCARMVWPKDQLWPSGSRQVNTLSP